MDMRVNCEVVSMDEVPSGDVRRAAEVQRPVILVVHDEVVVADSMATILMRAGFETLVAYNGKSALELAFATEPALLISDIGIRGMDGIQLAMAVVNAMPECKVLLFSGYETRRGLMSAQEQGYDFPWIAKPVHPAEVVKRVMACFEGCAVGVV